MLLAVPPALLAQRKLLESSCADRVPTKAALDELSTKIDAQADKESIAKSRAAVEHNLDQAILAYRGVIITGQGPN
jgi:hypothetical protein